MHGVQVNKLFPPKKLGLWLANQLSQPIRGHIFWWERAWIPICPLCSFQKTVTLVSICVFSTEEVHNHTGFIWNVMNFHPLTTQISLLKQRVAPFTANEITAVGNQFGVKVLIYLWKIYCYEILAFLFHLKKDE